MMIAGSAADLRRYPASAAAYLQDGLPPQPQWGIKADVRLNQDRLKATLAHLAAAGARDFYEGDLARSMAADLQAAGGALVGRGSRVVPRAWPRAARDPLSRRHGLCHARTHLRADHGAHIAPAAEGLAARRP